MKLLIDKDLHWSTAFEPAAAGESATEMQDYYKDLAAIAAKFALLGSYVVDGSGVTFRINAQKVTLDEVAMNEFFADFLNELFEVEIEYAALGGRGCDFSMRIVKATPLRNA